MFYLVIAVLIISSFHTEAVKQNLRQPNNDAGNNTRIIGGRAIRIKDVPWQVAILEGDNIICGGSIIANNLILTAAHCGKGTNLRQVSIRAGSTYSRRGGQKRRIAKIVYDGSYNERTSNNDIAIMKLRRPLQPNKYVRPVKLATNYQSSSGTAIVSGWGLTREAAEKTSPVLREVTVEFISLEQCRDDYEKMDVVITENMVCAGATNGGKDACQGDSGGPLVEDGVQYGVVSFGIGCGRASFPGVYTSVAKKMSWIQKVLTTI